MNLKALKPSLSSAAIAAAGSLSALVTMFVDVQSTLSIKWFLFLTWLSATTFILLIKRVDDLEKENNKSSPPSFERPIRILKDMGIIVIKNNSNFSSNIIVGCYLVHDGIENIAFAAQVYHVQEQVLQLKIIGNYCTEEDMNLIETKGASSTLIVRPNIPYELLEKLGEID
ncbi:TPA: hypothetical protein QHW78_003853 [Klebsiella aerogenes]|uniref:hypothetical protein n=1 Tax=Klebsiella aerogenes TaxID=548 RepID=UPI0013D6446D|nr:hypothetical protein [Klebsiella aerogenes]HDS4384029.1 hypothetical protein [Klebsiella aerogenes]